MSGEYYGAEKTKFYENNDVPVHVSTLLVDSGNHKSLPSRQNSNAIGTDNSGAAVKTINNILTGITNSVNRLSELHVQISESPRNRVVSPIACDSTDETTHVFGHQVIDTEIGIDKTCASKNRLNKNYIKTKLKDPKGAIRKQASQLMKKNIIVDRRINSTTCTQPFPSTTKRVVSSSKPQAKLVEIFHNKQAKSSDSDVCQRTKHSNQDEDPIQISVINRDTDVPILELPKETHQEITPSRSNTRRLCQYNLQDEYYHSQGARKSEISKKSYELPTIASRMKRVAKTYLNTFSFRAIPFCAAISTSPSHNIGMNIQQVMNIFKNRQPVNGISPTLAHNIGLAAERFNSKPLSTLVTTINSNTCYIKPQHCPLSKWKLNYKYLLDLARSIPEETVEEVECEDQQEDFKTIIITGPSGDIEVKSKNLPQWTADRSENNVCTCVPKAGLDINYICNKVNQKSENITTSQVSVSQKSKNMFDKTNIKNNKRPHTTQPTHTTPSNVFKWKEKSLKLVLTHLHDEFESLNKRYEDLSQNSNESDDPELIQKLETLEAELIKKENEITMVMTLCKEVMALKQQIKTLKQNNSQCSFPHERNDSSTSSNVNDFNNPRAALHLTKLLKEIQTYQLKYKYGMEV